MFSILVGLIFCGACVHPGISPGDPSHGWVIWGYLGEGTNVPATGQRVTLLNDAGEPVQSAVTDMMGKFVFAYHQPGNYTIEVGTMQVPVVVAGADQRLDIDLNNPSGQMNYATGAAGTAQQEQGGAAGGCPATPQAESLADTAATGATAPGASDSATPTTAGAAAGDSAEPSDERDPALAGSWGRTDTLSSGDASMSTKLSLSICPDGSYVHTTGDTVGGGASWSGESRGADVIRGKWRTKAGVVYVNPGSGWEPYARYYVEGAKLMFTFDNGNREIWYR